MNSILNFRLFPFFFLAIIYLIFSSQVVLASANKPMSYEDIVTFTKPVSVEISKEGSKLAFCVRKGSIEKNRNMDTLYIFDRNKGAQQKVAEFEEILQAKWENKDKDIYALIKESNVYKIISFDDQGSALLVESKDPIYLFSLSSDGTRLFYTKARQRDSEEIKNEIEEGHVYDLEQDSILKVIKGDYNYKEGEEIWCLNLTSSQSELMTFLPASNPYDQYYPIITSLNPSYDNKHLLVSFSKLGRPDLGGTPLTKNVVVWDTRLKEWYDPLNDSIYIEEPACWTRDSEFVFQQTAYAEGMSTLNYSLWLFDAKTRQGGCLNWLKISDHIKKFQWHNGLLIGISDGFVYKISLNEQRVEQIEIPTSFYDEPVCFDEQARIMGLIDQSINQPPEIAIYDIIEKKLTRLTSLNPLIENLALGKVEKITVKTTSGVTADGFLIHPVNEKPGVRYPIIIGTYGFQGKFITDAEWHSSFPAQTLAGDGYLVLLLNVSGTSQGFVGESKTARQIEGWDKLELFEEALDLLVERGLGDPNKVGIYGWSHGGFVVNFLISHSQKFHVACLGEGSDYNPGGFWAGGNLLWPKIYESTFGGPPWGETLKNYVEFSPFFNVDKIRAPLLLEFASESGNSELEMYIPLRYLGIPAELIIYNDEEHNFVRPKARIASMARKHEWFNFWLLNKRNSDPKKQKQYERWEKMREELRKKGFQH